MVIDSRTQLDSADQMWLQKMMSLSSRTFLVLLKSQFSSYPVMKFEHEILDLMLLNYGEHEQVVNAVIYATIVLADKNELQEGYASAVLNTMMQQQVLSAADAIVKIKTRRLEERGSLKRSK